MDLFFPGRDMTKERLHLVNVLDEYQWLFLPVYDLKLQASGKTDLYEMDKSNHLQKEAPFSAHLIGEPAATTFCMKVSDILSIADWSSDIWCLSKPFIIGQQKKGPELYWTFFTGI